MYPGPGRFERLFMFFELQREGLKRYGLFPQPGTFFAERGGQSGRLLLERSALLCRTCQLFFLIVRVYEVTAPLFGERGDLAFRHLHAVLPAAEGVFYLMDFVLERGEFPIRGQGIGPGLFYGRLAAAQGCVQIGDLVFYCLDLLC